jgi:chaperonin GroES
MTTSELLLPKYLVERNKGEAVNFETAKLPTPTGWRILIMPYNPPKVTKGGVEIPDDVHERERLAVNVGLVMAIGPLAYRDRKKFGNPDDKKENWQPWCKEKDWVLFGKYAGSRLKIDGGELRLLNDDEILAIVKDPSYLIHI